MVVGAGGDVPSAESGVPEVRRREFEKGRDIVDIWFESGVTHLAVLGKDGLNWPADLYLEGGDQFRGWFRSSLMTGDRDQESRAVPQRAGDRLGRRRQRARDA